MNADKLLLADVLTGHKRFTRQVKLPFGETISASAFICGYLRLNCGP